MFKSENRRVSATMGSLFAVAALATSLSALAEGTRLTGDALKQAVHGKTFTGATSRGGVWLSSYNADGTMAVSVVNSDWSDSGTWEIKDDQVCSVRTKRSYMCYQVFEVSPGAFEWIDERRQTTKSTYAK